jgi:hypothetical protein
MIPKGGFIESFRCPNCGIDIYPPEGTRIKVIPLERLQEGNKRYFEKLRKDPVRYEKYKERLRMRGKRIRQVCDQ